MAESLQPIFRPAAAFIYPDSPFTRSPALYRGRLKCSRWQWDGRCTRSPGGLDLGLIGLAQFCLACLFLVSGHVADRFDRRKVVTLCYCGFAFLPGCVAARVKPFCSSDLRRRRDGGVVRPSMLR
jgi:hypothetical protein